MKTDRRFILAFAGAALGGVCLHEIGHAVAGWIQGIPVFPTPAKEYVLLDRVEWSRMTWIALGGVVTTALLAAGTLVWYVRTRHARADAVLAGILLPPFVYSVRYLIVGRGHDAVEWQAAQSALGLAPAGHAIDALFLLLVLVATTAWIVRRRPKLRFSAAGKGVGLAVGGIALLVVLQVVNNALFDPLFPETVTVHVPEHLDPR